MAPFVVLLSEILKSLFPLPVSSGSLPAKPRTPHLFASAQDSRPKHRPSEGVGVGVGRAAVSSSTPFHRTGRAASKRRGTGPSHGLLLMDLATGAEEGAML